MHILFVRHGKDDERFRGGWSQLDLTPEGMTQAAHLARDLKTCKAFHISRILSSDLPRAMSTAAQIAAHLGLEVQKEPLLRETNNGDLAGMCNETALKQYPGLFFSSLDWEQPYPNGESPCGFYTRIRCWFEAFCREHRESTETVLIVTHGGVINIIRHLVRGKPWSNKEKPFPAAYCSLHILNTDTMTFEAENITDLSAL